MAQISTGYEEPDLSTPVFNVTRLSLEAPVRSRLAMVLASGVTNYNPTLDAKILGIALRLDPTNRSALAAAERRKRGELPNSKQGEPTYPTATIVTYFTGQSAGLRAKGGVDNLLLAGFLCDIAAEIDPESAAAKYEKAAFAKSNPPPSWAFLRTKAAASTEVLPLLKKQSKIRGLGIIELPSGDRTGSVMEMNITAAAVSDPKDVGVIVSESVGESMRGSLNEAWRSVKLRHPAFGNGQKLILNFGEDHSQKDGPSGGTAFTLLLYSLYDSLRLADDCAITGAVSVDGRVHAVGGVPSKIHVAQLAGCRVVAIPKENAGAVGDVSMLYPANTLWKLQIFTVDSLDEALAVMREDRPAALQKAIDLFAAIQRKLGPEMLRLSAANTDLIPQLREILRLAPGHASAKTMLAFLEGKMPNTLSLYSSLDEVTRITRATLVTAARSIRQRETEEQIITGGVTRLEALRPQLDFRVADLCAADLAGLRELQKVFTSRLSPEWAATYDQRVQTIVETETRMSTDLSLAEALRH